MLSDLSSLVIAVGSEPYVNNIYCDTAFKVMNKTKNNEECMCVVCVCVCVWQAHLADHFAITKQLLP